MKTLIIAIALLFQTAVFAQNTNLAPPTLIGMVPGPTNGFWVTNVTFVYTNTAVRTPTIDLGQVVVFGSNTLNNATVLAWAYSQSPLVWGYKLYYGQVGGATNTFLVNSNISTAAFFSSMTTTTQYWAYATAFDVSTNESIPSNQILFTPIH